MKELIKKDLKFEKKELEIKKQLNYLKNLNNPTS